jgi:hypothetical protein
VLPPTDKGRLVAAIFCAAKTNPALTSKKSLTAFSAKTFFCEAKTYSQSKTKETSLQK